MLRVSTWIQLVQERNGRWALVVIKALGPVFLVHMSGWVLAGAHWQDSPKRLRVGYIQEGSNTMVVICVLTGEAVYLTWGRLHWMHRELVPFR